ncbi:MAG: hydroxylamine reductase [Candidatus Omnitrophota bacterium]
MFCYQCEQTAAGKGCTKIGVCGKDEDIQSLQDTLLFGLMGIAAYAYHARQLGASDEAVDAFTHEALFKNVTNVSFDLNQYLQMVLQCGEMNLKAMELLDRAHTEKFGKPAPTEVSTGIKTGPGIVVTGHDLLDLYELLKQTQGRGINIYTHAEMLPAHGYPELRKFAHLAGNYGGAWQEQRKEFNEFNGPILATTNCVLVPPPHTYLNRLFTAGVAGIPGAAHIPNRDFTPLIEKALSSPPLIEKSGDTVTTGFHYSAVLGIADKIVDAVKRGKIRRFFLIGGCDGARPGRNYYTEFAELVPKDCVILTLACGKYRFNKMKFGAIEGIPRLIDAGQCNDAYSAIQIALALSRAFKCTVNELPLSFVLSWFEQKAVAILLTLFHLGIRGMYIGPTPPAFLSQHVFGLLKDTFDVRLISSPAKDLEAMLGATQAAKA